MYIDMFWVRSLAFGETVQDNFNPLGSVFDINAGVDPFWLRLNPLTCHHVPLLTTPCFLPCVEGRRLDLLFVWSMSRLWNFLGTKSQSTSHEAASFALWMIISSPMGSTLGQMVLGFFADLYGRAYLYGLELVNVIFATFGFAFTLEDKRRSKRTWVHVSCSFDRTNGHNVDGCSCRLPLRPNIGRGPGHAHPDTRARNGKETHGKRSQAESTTSHVAYIHRYPNPLQMPRRNGNMDFACIPSVSTARGGGNCAL
ncbi:hypothetical protein BCR34DRAFT_317701 [Clohesyomyces aquaticus]|uniref:Major facilitator superfamily (MFS) profile domain-containing protein n=1 Tax=Clohesyomyces aquaticus TaxID=1231657 RepID=A0A1Y1ZP45_9PLEO|nr:hypothetical protein BCR34DRAFT_317701 [Clohesyomyces aquaticus]